MCRLCGKRRRNPMIYGVGTDLVKVDRMQKSLASPSFWRRVFGEREQSFLQSLGEKHQRESAAANFAAKEAFLKAAGTGIGGFALAEIQVLRKKSGAPFFELTGTAAQWAEEQSLHPHLSLSHDGGMAQAFVVLEQAENA